MEPRQRRAAAPDPAALVARPAATARVPRVLVVDDDPYGLALTARLLACQGYDVEAACDGTEALEALARRLPDLVVLDVVMPRLSGIEVLHRMRSDPRQARIPVILLTARRGDDDLLEGYRVGADCYLTKPFTPHELLDGIALVLGAARVPDGRWPVVRPGRADPSSPA